MKKLLAILAALAAFFMCTGLAGAREPDFKLGNEVLMTKYHYLIEGKRVGLITNQSGVNSKGQSTIEVLANDKAVNLVALYGPEHGIDGTARAGAYVESYTHPELGIPVYSLYGATRMPTEEMLRNVDVLVFDVQDIGARSYTYKSTLNYCMIAAQKYNKTIVVLDRPNPVGGEIVEGPVLEDRFKSFVGIDNLPMAHGMTTGELARFFNRKIGADLKVVPMEGYTRDMIFEDTGLKWVQTSPNIPDLASVRGYMATGLGEGTGIFQADKFKWIGGKGIDAYKFAAMLNGAGLPGVAFIPEQRGEAGGVRLQIEDPRIFNPAKTGIYALTYAHSLTNFQVPKSGNTIVMFDKIMGTDKIGQYLEQGLTPQQIEACYAADLERFKEERKKYLIYGYKPEQREPGDNETEQDTGLPGQWQRGQITVLVDGRALNFDAAPYIDEHNRTMVPLRAIGEALGAQVQWDPAARTVTYAKQGYKVVFTIDISRAFVNGEQKYMDTGPVIKNKRTMVPLRYVSEFLGAVVDWDPSSRTVTVNQ